MSRAAVELIFTLESYRLQATFFESNKNYLGTKLNTFENITSQMVFSPHNLRLERPSALSILAALCPQTSGRRRTQESW